MSDQTDNVVDEVGTFVYDNPEAEWAAVLAVAPAMDRLPDMVANTYEGYGLPQGYSVEELRSRVRDRIRTGSIFVFKLIDNNVNLLFENFSVHFGQGIDLLMDDLEVAMSSDIEAVENYTGEEVCGRLFAYIAMDIHTQNRDKENPNLDMVDEETGLYKDMDYTACRMHLDDVLKSVRMTPEFAAEAREWGLASIRAQIFMLAELPAGARLH